MKKGFTLIELLAVIVVLAIILVIAIPNVMKIITQSKLDVYARNEELLIEATRSYLTQNGISLNSGESLTVNYTTLKTNNFIEPIKDLDSDNECTQSKVYITNTSGTYIYKAGLICDNYLSLKTFDLLKGLGNFAKDSNSDGVADGFLQNGTRAINLSVQNNIQYYTANDVNAGIYYRKDGFALPIQLGQQYYLYAKVKSTSVTRLALENASGSVIYHTGSNNFETLTGIFIPTSDIGAIILYENVIGTNVQTKNWYALNLTYIYGAGNEPTKAVMDKLVGQSY